MSSFSNYTISNFVLTRPRVLDSEKHQKNFIKKPSSIGLINILVFKKVNSRGSLKDWLALIQDENFVLLLNLPSFFSGILNSTNIGTEDSCWSSSKWFCLVQIVGTEFRVNTLRLFRLTVIHSLLSHEFQSIILWFSFFSLYIDCQSKYGSEYESGPFLFTILK